MSLYWDFNAGAPLLPQALEAMTRAHREAWGNPSSVHASGRRARAHLDEARERIAGRLGAASPREIVFTGSGSEAAALAIVGAWLGRGATPRRTIVSTAIEHPSVLGALERVEALGARVVRLPPGPEGAVDASALIAALDDDVYLCSVMWANNETGVVQPVMPVAEACRARGIWFHSDAAQAMGRLPVDLRQTPVDLLSWSAHKLGGPAGAGVLYARRSAPLLALVPGHQEDGRRGGTPSVAQAEASAIALEHACAQQGAMPARLAALRGRFEATVAQRWRAVVNGAGAERLCNTSSVTFPGVDGEALLIALDLAGVAVSTGAACASGSLSPSHVLLAMGLTSAQARGTLRFSMGPAATESEVDGVLDALERALRVVGAATRP